MYVYSTFIYILLLKILCHITTYYKYCFRKEVNFGVGIVSVWGRKGRWWFSVDVEVPTEPPYNPLLKQS